MTDKPVWQRAEIESPCINVCVLHPEAKICIGCYRTGEEIRDWMRYDAETRRELIETLPNRADQVKPRRRGGRSRHR